MQDYREKRNYPRMDIECPASFEVVNGDGGGAIVKNLSGGGLLMWLDRAIEPNATLMLEIKPINDITPPMQAEVQVLRCTPVEGGEGSFAIACQISRVLG
ncbi:MAG: PilZ domain-containing protein [Chromatiaceae bacterium]|nr:PilZ domain-containing protein [Gammaproteobacteria bacterium]MCP5300394.1 PilZ domain-containing protein [Chromatiaceae bacterium]MCP5422466.1 PilZ domain-containing protein [Chromatiaceae bacterium]